MSFYVNAAGKEAASTAIRGGTGVGVFDFRPARSRRRRREGPRTAQPGTICAMSIFQPRPAASAGCALSLAKLYGTGQWASAAVYSSGNARRGAGDFSVVSLPFFTPQKKQKNAPNRRKIGLSEAGWGPAASGRRSGLPFFVSKKSKKWTGHLVVDGVDGPSIDYVAVFLSNPRQGLFRSCCGNWIFSGENV